jgi:hypothetical protein
MWVFETDIAKVSKAGFLIPRSRGPHFATNGSILVRTELGIKSPSKGHLRNQFSDQELLGGCGEYFLEHQLDLFTEAFQRLYSDVRKEVTGQMQIQLPIHFSFVEFYQEILLPAKREEFFAHCCSNISKIFGAEMMAQENLKIVSSRETIRSQFSTHWLIGHPIKRGKRQEIRLKFYEKGDRVRLEVSFRGFKAGTSQRHLVDYGQLSIGDECSTLLNSLALVAREVIGSLIPSFSNATLKKLNAGALRRKLKGYGARTVKGPSYSNLIQSLDTRTVYDPINFPKDERVNKRMLKRLSDPQSGILERKSPPGSKSNKFFFSLREDWEKVTSPLELKSDSEIPF